MSIMRREPLPELMSLKAIDKLFENSSKGRVVQQSKTPLYQSISFLHTYSKRGKQEQKNNTNR